MSGISAVSVESVGREGSLTRGRLVVGVDPGLSGAVAILKADTGKLISLFDMPTKKIGNKRHVNAKVIYDYLLPIAPFIDLVIVEDVHSMPSDGVVSAFTFGYGFGVINGVFDVLSLNTQRIKPSVWKPALGLSGDKEKSLELARKLFPDKVEWFFRKKDDGRAEAAILAHHFAILLGGTSDS